MEEIIRYNKRICDHTAEINVEHKDIEIRLSRHGDGVFAKERIKKDTIFYKYKTLNLNNVAAENPMISKINDLAFNGNIEEYNMMENIVENINIGHLVVTGPNHNPFFPEIIAVYVIALKDIECDEELSKYYGEIIWKSFLFYQQFPNNKYRITFLLKDLPSEYIPVYRIIQDLQYNHYIQLYCKLIDDKYYYATIKQKPEFETLCMKKYYDKDFLSTVIVTDISKPDHTLYEESDTFFIDDKTYYFSTYLQKLKSIRK